MTDGFSMVDWNTCKTISEWIRKYIYNVDPIIKEKLAESVEALESEISELKQKLWESEILLSSEIKLYHKERDGVESVEKRLTEAEKILDYEYFSPTSLKDIESIKDYEHVTCGEEYADVVLKRVRKALRDKP